MVGLGMKMERKVKLLKDSAKIFQDNDVDFFALYGILLGFIRNRQIIPWDEDIDFGAWYPEYDKVRSLEDGFKKLGYKMIGSGMRGKYRHITICYDLDEFIDEETQKKLRIPEQMIKKTLEITDKKTTAEICKKIDDVTRNEYTYYLDNHIIIGKDLDYFAFHAGIDFFAKDIDKVIRLHFYDNNTFDKYFERYEKKIKSIKSIFKIYNFFKEFYRILVLYVHMHDTYPSAWFDDMGTIKAYNMDFKILSLENCEKFLEYSYGPNWRMPDRGYGSEDWMITNKANKRHKIRDKDLLQLWLKREKELYSLPGRK